MYKMLMITVTLEFVGAVCLRDKVYAGGKIGRLATLTTAAEESVQSWATFWLPDQSCVMFS